MIPIINLDMAGGLLRIVHKKKAYENQVLNTYFSELKISNPCLTQVANQIELPELLKVPHLQ